MLWSCFIPYRDATHRNLCSLTSIHGRGQGLVRAEAQLPEKSPSYWSVWVCDRSRQYDITFLYCKDQSHLTISLYAPTLAYFLGHLDRSGVTFLCDRLFLLWRCPTFKWSILPGIAAVTARSINITLLPIIWALIIFTLFSRPRYTLRHS
jgi:hypothetical protein